MSCFVYCERCKKKLIERTTSGIWIFKFGKRDNSQPVVDLEIHGSIKMRCTRRTCGHLNILHYFPPTQSPEGKDRS